MTYQPHQSEDVALKVGDRVRAKEAIYEPADDHAPGGYLCMKGDLLIVRKLTPQFKRSLSVSHESETERSFGVEPSEVEPEGVAAPAPPAMPDDYWLHVRGCDCTYCAWERAGGVALPSPTLAVWFGAMPESNGKANWTAILHRVDISATFTIERSEHHDRVRYEADRVRYLIGELAEEPDILAYDPNMLSPAGWVHPCGMQACDGGQQP